VATTSRGKSTEHRIVDIGPSQEWRLDLSSARAGVNRYDSPANAIDGYEDTMWSSLCAPYCTGEEHWIEAQFAAPSDVSRVQLLWDTNRNAPVYTAGHEKCYVAVTVGVRVQSFDDGGIWAGLFANGPEGSEGRRLAGNTRITLRHEVSMGIPAYGTFLRVLADYVSLRFGWNSAWRLPALGSLNCPDYDYDYPLTTTSTAAGAYIYKTELIYLPLYPKLLPRSRRDEWHPAWAGVTIYEIRAYGTEVNATVSN
ncbi:nipblb, partial [Symbiodinium sp. KB8]